MSRSAVLGWLLAGALGAVLFWYAYPRVFPEASIDLRITPREAQQRGLDALRQLQPDLNLQGWRSATEFDWDNDAKRYLEKTLGLQRANAAMRDEVSVWYFYTRWAREGERVDYWTRVAPSGAIIAAGYALPEEAKGAQLSANQARAIAEQFLQKQLQVNLAQWRPVDAYQHQRPNRRDHVFFYEHRSRKYPADSPTPATLRLRVDVAGDRVSRYDLNWLHTPEKWAFEQRQREGQRAALSAVFGVLYTLLHWIGIGLAVWLVIRRQSLSWRFALRLILLLLAVEVAAQLNFYPLWWISYDTAEPEPTFLGQILLDIFSAALVTGIFWFAFALTAEWLNRARPLGEMPLAKLTTVRFWTTREALVALWAGLCFAGVHLAYLCGVYQLSFRLGAWSPLDVPYTNGVALPLPFLEPLLQGLLPAVQEELMFRGIALFLLWRILKRFWLAALLSSIVWAFLHVGYPTEPAYLRGLELIPVGLSFCWLAARYGILAPMAAHYTYNALLTAVTYLNMDSPALRLSALVTALGVALLFLPALVTYLRTRRLPTLAEVDTPACDIPPPPQAHEPRVAPYRPLTRLDWAMLIGAAALLVGTAVYASRTETAPLARELSIDRNQAVQNARAYLQQLGVNLEGYRALPFFVELEEDDLARYARDVGQEDRYEQIQEEDAPDPGYWQVWFFRPQERTQWYVYLHLDGEVFDRQRILPEEASGDLPNQKPQAKLSEAQARRLAEQYLTQEQEYDLAEWRLIETDRTEHPNRYDYVFTYEHRTRQVGEARQRLSVEVQGSLAQNVGKWWDIPEQWYFDQRRVQAWSVFAGIWIVALVVALGAYVVFWEWREGNASSFTLGLALRALLLGSLAGVAYIAGKGEMFLWQRYDTATTPTLHLSLTAISGVMIVLLLGAIGAILFMGLEPSYWRTRLGHLVPLSVWLAPARWSDAPPDSPLRHPRAMREGFLVALTLSLALGVQQYLYPETLWNVDSPRAWLELLGVSLLAMLLLGGLALAAAGGYRRYLRPWWRVLLLAVLLAPATMIGVDSWAQWRENLYDYALGWALVVLGGLLLGKRLLQGNLLAWALLLFWSVLLGFSAPYLACPAPALQAQGWLLLAVFALSALLAGLFMLRPRAPERAAVSPEAAPEPLSAYAAVQMETPHAPTERGEA
ncbi:MAG: CPBP family intramembrane metalloprotease [Fimbriimonadales bacterium]|nr:CPBP family intramembrane metalloprotease [Fimbriimonadales bacterium]